MTDYIKLTFDNAATVFVMPAVTGVVTATDIDNAASSIGLFRANIQQIDFLNTVDGPYSIDLYAFQNCTSLTTITDVASNVNSFGDGCFYGCSALTSLTIPISLDSMFGLGVGCFTSCSALVNVTIPNNITTLPEGCFSNCALLNTVSMPSISSIEKSCFEDCIALQNVTIPSAVTSLPEACFQGCTTLANFTIPNTITDLGNACFSECYVLNPITIPNSVSTLGSACFRNCLALTDVTIPGSVISIGDHCFQNCAGLINIVMDDVTTLAVADNTAFIGCTDAPNRTVRYNGLTNASQLGVATPASNFDAGLLPLWQRIFDASINCFRHGSKILVYFDNKEQYLPIEQLFVGCLVKTVSNGYKPISRIGRGTINNIKNDGHVEDRLYKLTKDAYPELFEDLIVTGWHAILVDDVTQEQRRRTEEIMGATFVTGKKYRLPACVDDRAKLYEGGNIYDIYHIALECPEFDGNYGIYANGLLVESTSNKRLATSDNLKSM